MQNIELFEEYTATLFAKLYQHFPVSTDINPGECIGHMSSELDYQAELKKRLNVATATFKWLRDAGYIKDGGSTSQHAGGVLVYTDCVLTAKGLEVLKSIPDDQPGKGAIGDRIVSSVQSGAIDLAKKAANLALAAGANYL